MFFIHVRICFLFNLKLQLLVLNYILLD